MQETRRPKRVRITPATVDEPSENEQSGETENISEAVDTVPPFKIDPTLNMTQEERMRGFRREKIYPVDDQIGTFFRKRFNVYDSSHAWNDLDKGKGPVVHLMRLSDRSIVELGIETFQDLKTNPTSITIGNLFRLIYNSRDERGKYLFTELSDNLVSKEVRPYRLNDEYLCETTDITDLEYSGDANNVIDMKRMAISFSFVATSYIRLLTKSAENFTLIDGHLKMRFKNFYKYDIRIHNFHPVFENIQAVKEEFGNQEIFLHTLYALIYAGECSPWGHNLKQFLYKIHISYTGMHSFLLFTRCAHAYNLIPYTLANILYCDAHAIQIRALGDLYENCVIERPGLNDKQMWRFARIFDSRFFVELQTKNCQHFAVLLVYLSKKCGAERPGQDALKIKQIEDIHEDIKYHAAAYADRYDMIIRHLSMGKNFEKYNLYA